MTWRWLCFFFLKSHASLFVHALRWAYGMCFIIEWSAAFVLNSYKLVLTGVSQSNSKFLAHSLGAQRALLIPQHEAWKHKCSLDIYTKWNHSVFASRKFNFLPAAFYEPIGKVKLDGVGPFAAECWQMFSINDGKPTAAWMMQRGCLNYCSLGLASFHPFARLLCSWMGFDTQQF